MLQYEHSHSAYKITGIDRTPTEDIYARSDGEEAFKRSRNKRRMTPLFVLTAEGQQDTLLDAPLPRKLKIKSRNGMMLRKVHSINEVKSQEHYRRSASIVDGIQNKYPHAYIVNATRQRRRPLPETSGTRDRRETL